MGKLVDYRKTSPKRIAPGVSQVAITAGEGQHMSADVLKLESHATQQAAAPAGSDQFFVTPTGQASLTVEGVRHALGPGRFAILQEGKQYAVTAGALPAEVLSVVAPPAASGSGLPGFKGGVKVMSKDDEPVDDIPAAKKQRIYFGRSEE